MDNLGNELVYDLSEKLFEGGCEINAKRIKLLNQIVFKMCKNIPKLEQMFAEELKQLQELDQEEEEIRRNCAHLL